MSTVPHRWTRNRVLFMAVAWLIVLMPFLFWRATWFGRPLSDQAVTASLRDEQHPREIQHALVQIGERMSRGQDTSRWYPELVRLAAHPAEEIRNTDAWIMGQDTSRPEFHAALLTLLRDTAPLVRSNAALALVRFGDASGHDQIVSMLRPAAITTPAAGRVTDTARVGASLRQHGTVIKLEVGSKELDIRSPLAGRVHSVQVQPGDQVAAGTQLATVTPGEDQVWEALRALYVVGRPEDLPIVTAYQRDLPDMPDRIRQQAASTARAIADKTKSP